MATNKNESVPPSSDDPDALRAQIRQLQAQLKGPDGFATWRDAAINERLRCARFERLIRSALQLAPESIGKITTFEQRLRLRFPEATLEQATHEQMRSAMLDELEERRVLERDVIALLSTSRRRELIESWLASDEGKSAVARAAQEAATSVGQLAAARRVTREQLCAPLAGAEPAPAQANADAVRYAYLLDCDFEATRRYLPNLDKAEWLAKLRAKHDAACAARAENDAGAARQSAVIGYESQHNDAGQTPARSQS